MFSCKLALKTAQSIFFPSDQSVLMTHPVLKGSNNLINISLQTWDTVLIICFQGNLQTRLSHSFFITDNHAEDFIQQPEPVISINATSARQKSHFFTSAWCFYCHNLKHMRLCYMCIISVTTESGKLSFTACLCKIVEAW